MNININNLIFPYDYIIITIFMIILLICSWKGLIQSVLGFLTWIGSILITIYTYEGFANFLFLQISKIVLFQDYAYATNILSIIISIPIIFLLTLFILKRIRKILSTDLDKQILGIILDKFFGFIYGILFSYIVVTAIIILLSKFNLDILNNWLFENSNILYIINEFNINNIFVNNNLEIIENN